MLFDAICDAQYPIAHLYEPFSAGAAYRKIVTLPVTLRSSPSQIYRMR